MFRILITIETVVNPKEINIKLYQIDKLNLIKNIFLKKQKMEEKGLKNISQKKRTGNYWKNKKDRLKNQINL